MARKELIEIKKRKREDERYMHKSPSPQSKISKATIPLFEAKLEEVRSPPMTDKSGGGQERISSGTGRDKN